MRLHRLMSTLGAALLLLLAGSQQCFSAITDTTAPPEVLRYNGTMYASCKMRPSTSLSDDLPKVYGQALFKQDYPQGRLQVLLWFSGFPTEGGPQPRAVHIHQFGDLSRGCDSTGGHYNPHRVDHPNHPGDFGNLEPQNGKIKSLIQSEATLFTGLSVIGRAVVVHKDVDDLGLGGDANSLLHGNAGHRLGCCIIGISSPDHWNKYYKMYNSQLRRK